MCTYTTYASFHREMWRKVSILNVFKNKHIRNFLNQNHDDNKFEWMCIWRKNIPAVILYDLLDRFV